MKRVGSVTYRPATVTTASTGQIGDSPTSSIEASGMWGPERGGRTKRTHRKPGDRRDEVAPRRAVSDERPLALRHHPPGLEFLARDSRGKPEWSGGPQRLPPLGGQEPCSYGAPVRPHSDVGARSS